MLYQLKRYVPRQCSITIQNTLEHRRYVSRRVSSLAIHQEQQPMPMKASRQFKFSSHGKSADRKRLLDQIESVTANSEGRIKAIEVILSNVFACPKAYANRIAVVVESRQVTHTSSTLFESIGNIETNETNVRTGRQRTRLTNRSNTTRLTCMCVVFRYFLRRTCAIRATTLIRVVQRIPFYSHQVHEQVFVQHNRQSIRMRCTTIVHRRRSRSLFGKR
jgi:hypothetical protein